MSKKGKEIEKRDQSERDAKKKEHTLSQFQDNKGYPNKGWDNLTKVIKVLKKENQQSRGCSNRMMSGSRRNLIGMRLVKFQGIEILKQDENERCLWFNFCVDHHWRADTWTPCEN